MRVSQFFLFIARQFGYKENFNSTFKRRKRHNVVGMSQTCYEILYSLRVDVSDDF